MLPDVKMVSIRMACLVPTLVNMQCGKDIVKCKLRNERFHS